jgi:twinkle protein
MISSNTIEQVKNRMQVVDVVGDFVKLKKRGSEYEACCPFHSEKTPSFKVNAVKEIYKCFGCGKSGDAISFLQEHEKMDYIAAIKWLANKYNVEIEETNKEYVKPEPRLQKVGDKALKFFESRGISNNTLLRLGITESAEWMSDSLKEVPVICFNYYRGEELVNIKFRGPQKSFRLSKDAELIFYNLNSLKDEKVAVIVEGEMDCLAMHESGIYNCVSVPNGAAKGNQKLQYLDNCWQYFENVKKIIIAVDNDEPGNLLKEELGRRLGKERCLIVTYPDGCKDANDVLLNYGKDAVQQLVNDAKEWPIEGIIHVEELFEEIVDYYLDGYPTGSKAHIPNFDDHISFVAGQMTMVTGIPGSGKDEFLNYIAGNLAKFEDWNFGMVGFEEPPPITVTKLQEKVVGKSFAHRRNPDARINQDEFKNSLQFIKEHFYFINAEQIGAEIDVILSKSAELVKRYGIKGLILNPWNCFEHKKKNGQSETEYISETLTKINNFDVKYGVHTFLVAHPTKIEKDKNTNKYKVPTLYNISGSAHFFNKSYNGICIYRDFETNTVDVYFQKIKWSWLGKVGFCSFSFNTETRQYVPLS